LLRTTTIPRALTAIPDRARASSETPEDRPHSRCHRPQPRSPSCPLRIPTSPTLRCPPQPCTSSPFWAHLAQLLSSKRCVSHLAPSERFSRGSSLPFTSFPLPEFPDTCLTHAPFAQFVYHPHIEPTIDRWRAEYEARRRQRRAAAEVPMTERNQTFPPDEPPHGNDRAPHASPSQETLVEHPRMKDGLLRLPPNSSPSIKQESPTPPDSPGLLCPPEALEWRNEISSSTGQDLRQRRNAAHASAGHAPQEVIFITWHLRNLC